MTSADALSDNEAAWRWVQERPLWTGAVPARPVADFPLVEQRMPMGAAFLFIDEVLVTDRVQRIVVARFSLERHPAVLSAHFPARPIWPGTLQVEAIGQAALWLHLAMEEPAATARRSKPMLAAIRSARFMREVRPGRPVEIQAGFAGDGELVRTIVGQCLQDGHICSAAVLVALIEEEESA